MTSKKAKLTERRTRSLSWRPSPGVWRSFRANRNDSRHKPRRLVGFRIAERRRAGHQLGDEAPGRRTEREAPMAVAAGEPEAALARGRRDHRPRVGKAGPRAEPGLRLDRLAERKQFARRRDD